MTFELEKHAMQEDLETGGYDYADFLKIKIAQLEIDLEQKISWGVKHQKTRQIRMRLGELRRDLRALEEQEDRLKHAPADLVYRGVPYRKSSLRIKN